MNVDTLDQLRSVLQESRVKYEPDCIVVGVDVTGMLSELISTGDDGIRAAVLTYDELRDPVVPLESWSVFDVALLGSLAFSIVECANEERSCAINYWQFEDLVSIAKWPAVAWEAYRLIQDELKEKKLCIAPRSATSTDDTPQQSKS